MSDWRGDPRKRFYMVVTQGNLDGTIDLSSELPDVCNTLDEAIASASEQANETDLAFFVYECRPMKRVARLSVKIEDLADEEVP